MTANEFFDQMDARIAKHDLLCHPFYKAWSAGTLTREDLQRYGREYFHHVAAFPVYLEEFGARVEDDQLRRAVEVNREDELGMDGSRPHPQLWLDFVEGMGGDRNPSQYAPIAEITQLMESFHHVARERTPEEALAAFYAYESQVPRIAQEKERGLRDRYGADDKTCGYFSLHATADVYHSKIWRKQLEKRIASHPEAADAALDAAENAARILWKALEGIEAARVARAA